MHLSPRVVVLGDIHTDSLLVPAPVEASAAATKSTLRENHFLEFRRPGGAWLLTEIVDASLAAAPYNEKLGRPSNGSFIPLSVDTPMPGNATSPDGLPRFITLLRTFPQAHTDDKKKVYRVDRPLGWISTAELFKDNRAYAARLRNAISPLTQPQEPKADILVFNDSAGHFRDLNPDLLKDLLKQQLAPGTGWIVWHMYSPLAEGHLWDVVSKTNPDWLSRTIVIVNMECLRQAGMDLPQITSLEKESELFRKGMTDVKRLAELGEAHFLVAHQQREGVILHEKGRGLGSTCHYCPYLAGESLPNGGGTMIGYGSILTATIVRALAYAVRLGTITPLDAVTAAIKQGIVLDHLHYLDGFGTEDELHAFVSGALTNPYGKLFASLAGLEKTGWEADGRSYFVTSLALKKDTDLVTWTRIDGFIESKCGSALDDTALSDEDKQRLINEQAEKIAADIVTLGLKAVLEDRSMSEDLKLPSTPGKRVLCPYEVHGVIKTAYRKEIDGFANIRRIIEKYLNDESWKTPLSIAVFGQPGSGKSFAVKQILENVNREVARRPLTFNMSQMSLDGNDLETALHKVQDEAITGAVPLVCFDEFDAEGLRWLKFFLAPMQDGEFKAGESTYRIGRSIFVFSGGVSKSWNEFYDANMKEAKKDEFVAKKGPDFVSRLRGYLEIESINPPENGAGEVDNVLMFRRAILLRSSIEKYLAAAIDVNSKKAWIDPDVVRAFLRIPKYVHQVRSLQAIVEMSRLSPRGTFDKSSLPTEHQLKMHVDAPQFVGLLVGTADGKAND